MLCGQRCRGVNMWRYIIFACAIIACAVEVIGAFNKLITKGKWRVEHVENCEDPDQYKFNFAIQRKKLNRTHDGFNIEGKLPTEMNKENIGYYVEACIKVDGGCKLVQIFKSPSFCDFLNEHAKDNFKMVLAKADLEQDSPIPAGHYEVNDFLIDYDEFPEEGVHGRFKTTVYLRNGDENLSCNVFDIIFEETY